jgi:hypothetical protein
MLRPKFLVPTGLMADFGAEVVDLMRTLEPRDYDVANLGDDVNRWFERQTRLFQDLQILMEMPGQEDHPERQTCTWTIVKNAMECDPIHVGSKVYHLWSAERGDKEEMRDIIKKMSNVIHASNQRMKAEFCGTLQMDFSAFSFRRWRRSRKYAVSTRAAFEADLVLKLKRLFTAANCDPDAGVRQFLQVMRILYEEFETQLRDQLPNQTPDNRVLWRRAFQEDVRSQANRNGDISVLCWDLTTLLRYQLLCCESALGCNRLVL